MKSRVLLLVFGCLLLGPVGVQAKARKPPYKGLLVNGAIVYDIATGNKNIITPGFFDDGEGELDDDGYLSPNGGTILLAVNIWENHTIVSSELRTVDIDGKNARTWYQAKNIWRYAWSPDGRFIFVHAGTTHTDLFIDTQSEDAWLVKIPKEYTSPVSPIWSRDGQHLFYARSNGPENDSGFTIDRTNLNGGNPHPVATITRDGMPALSPDEKTIAFIAPFEQDLYLMDVGTGDMRLMRRTRASEIGQFWSPDSKWVGVRQDAWSSMNPDKFYAVNVETGKWHFLLEENDAFLTWWQPPTAPFPDCAKIIHDQLGPGRPLEEVIRTIPK